jgi:hypothetical protein
MASFFQNRWSAPNWLCFAKRGHAAQIGFVSQNEHPRFREANRAGRLNFSSYVAHLGLFRKNRRSPARECNLSLPPTPSAVPSPSIWPPANCRRLEHSRIRATGPQLTPADTVTLLHAGNAPKYPAKCTTQNVRRLSFGKVYGFACHTNVNRSGRSRNCKGLF